MTQAVIAAFQREVAPFLDVLCDRRRLTIGGRKAWIGQLGRHRVLVLIAGMGPGKARHAVRALQQDPVLEGVGPVERIISVGFAGGLAPGLAIGDLMVADRLMAVAEDGSTETFEADSSGARLAVERFGARRGLLVTCPKVVGAVVDKRALHERQGAMAVDMEAAAIARETRIPVLPLKVILDGPDEALKVTLATIPRLARQSKLAAKSLNRGLQLLLDHDPRNPYPFSRWLARTLFGGVPVGTPKKGLPVYPMEIEGLENLPPGPKVLAFNHQSWLDVCMIYGAFPFHVHYMGKQELFEVPFLGQFLHFHGVIPIQRGTGNGLDTALAALRRGEIIAIFPEGTIPGEENVPRSAVLPETGMLPGKTGAVRLALKAGVPLIPVGITGTGEALPVEAAPHLQTWPIPARSVRLRMRIGHPFDLEALRGSEPTATGLRDATDRLMLAIASLFDRPTSAAPRKELTHV